MPKTKTLQYEELDIAPPTTEAISAKYLIKVPVNDSHLKSSEEVESYASRILEKKLGDDVDLKSLKIQRPGLTSKTMAKMRGRIPTAKLYVTVKF